MTYLEARGFIVQHASKNHKNDQRLVQDAASGQLTNVVDACVCWKRDPAGKPTTIDLSLGCNCGVTQHNLSVKSALKAFEEHWLIQGSTLEKQTEVVGQVNALTTDVARIKRKYTRRSIEEASEVPASA